MAITTFKLINPVHIILSAISDYKCGEFHVTPVITLAWPREEDREHFENINKSYVIAFEWGFWAVYGGFATVKRVGAILEKDNKQ